MGKNLQLLFQIATLTALQIEWHGIF